MDESSKRRKKAKKGQSVVKKATRKKKTSSRKKRSTSRDSLSRSSGRKRVKHSPLKDRTHGRDRDGSNSRYA
jgi:hypothetical protein